MAWTKSYKKKHIFTTKFLSKEFRNDDFPKKKIRCCFTPYKKMFQHLVKLYFNS